MEIFDGNAHAQILEEKIKGFLKTHSSVVGENAPKLGIVQIGNNPSSKTYVNLKKKFCDSVGISVAILSIDDNLSDVAIIDQVKDFFADPSVLSGIVQLPLPRKSLDPVLGVIPVEKDLDLLSPESKRRFYAGDFSRLPPTVRAFDYFLEHTELDQEQPTIGVVGYGELVGRPISHYCSVSGYCTEVIGYYKNQTKLDYQVLVLSAGIPLLVDPQNLAKGTSVVDFGYSKIGNKTVGDLDMSKNLDHLRFISPSV
ncbi:bifunctional 5,10-methylenetetrahydrofolate dehydrogenase/5,10-methenyltetrahydrofolate cyclohydrolase, partial [Patescibacteria group bacterium]|nr:bifunctional 5,10-methylenetetrahydrofolate dehydrogenase/5,10-methenyltetrahydrofolate cyclohydrolase [Patescibacteria group bacterium]